ncbi:hypothetical protein ACFYXH_14635 [Streptomyces sp. NPDC002730]|uniref:hypothetical protein n=1 Tax=Streptomyces sp. NPDC002730 TaxID=3364662 RepID=UPI0036CEA402
MKTPGWAVVAATALSNPVDVLALSGRAPRCTDLRTYGEDEEGLLESANAGHDRETLGRSAEHAFSLLTRSAPV